MLLFNFFLIVHIIAGTVSLITLWIPLVVRKGGKAHRVTGWMFVWSMAIVAVSALYMGMYRVFFDPDADIDQISFSWFLIFISILSGATAWYGIRVLRFKTRTERHRNGLDLFVSLLLLISGVSISIYGFVLNAPLISYFPFIGIFVGTLQLMYWLRKPTRRKHWYFEHFGGMIPCCIASVTAFLVFGGPRMFGVEATNLLLWLLPTAFFVVLLIGFDRYYKRKFS